MNETILSLIILLPGLMFLLSNISTGPFNKLNFSYQWITAGVYIALIGGLCGIGFISMNQSLSIELLSAGNLGLTVRIDSLSMILFTMIAIIALVVVRYSRNYMDGDPRHQQFITRLAFTIAFVQLLVISGNLAGIFAAWIGTSLGLHQLLIFYPERKRARLAAKKKFIIARLGDIALLTAFILIYQHFGTGDLATIFEQSKLYLNSSIPFQLELAGVFLILSASLKSVQVPFHGWLLDVMEAPTPVSALLHAGLLNAGPFLIIRFAYLMDLMSTATTALVIIGATSALFGAIAATMQPTIKTALAYSSVGHMGFTLMVCGLGVYSASLLHLIAHSFYKAHAFLSSGSVIDKVQTKNALNYKRLNSSWRQLIGILVASGLFIGITYLWQQSTQIEFQMMVISAIIFLGILSLKLNTFDSNNSLRSTALLLGAAALVINFFFFFEHSIALYLGNEIPEIRNASLSLQNVSVGILILFSFAVLYQSISASISEMKTFQRLELHFRNGLYINHYMDKLLNSLSIK